MFLFISQISDDLTEDTLWEITTSWQDALSSNDLQLDDELLGKCSAIIDCKLSQVEDISVEQIENISEIVSKLILCSIERIENETERYNRADSIIDTIFNQKNKLYRSNITSAENLCLFLESINGQLTVPDIGNSTVEQISSDQKPQSVLDAIDMLLKLAVFKFNVIFKITCSIKKKQVEDGETEEAGDDECTEDFCDVEETLIKIWSDNIFDEILDGVYVASLGMSLLKYASMV